MKIDIEKFISDCIRKAEQSVATDCMSEVMSGHIFWALEYKIYSNILIQMIYSMLEYMVLIQTVITFQFNLVFRLHQQSQLRAINIHRYFLRVIHKRFILGLQIKLDLIQRHGQNLDKSKHEKTIRGRLAYLWAILLFHICF